jgi:hypothetical protein
MPVKQTIVPFAALERISRFVGKSRKQRSDGSFIILIFTSKGLYLVTDTVKFFVPVTLDIDSPFALSFDTLKPVFQRQNRIPVTFEQYGNSKVKVMYACRKETKELVLPVVDWSPEFLWNPPAVTIESTTFLPALATGFPFIDFSSGQTALRHFCLTERCVVATDRIALCACEDVDIPFFPVETPFLLDGRIAPALPASGACRLGAITLFDRTWLYIGLADGSRVWVCGSNAGTFPKWKSVMPEASIKNQERPNILNIDKDDAQTLLSQFDLWLPGLYKPAHRSVEQGYLLFRSFSNKIVLDTVFQFTEDNFRFCFSERTKGGIRDETMIKGKYLKKILPLSLRVSQYPFDDCGKNVLIFHGDNFRILLCVYEYGPGYEKKITKTIDLADCEAPVAKGTKNCSSK